MQSILLLSKVPAEELGGRTVALTNTSRTSQVLARILLAKRWGVDADYVEMPPDLPAMLRDADAALLIGDEALRAYWEPPDGPARLRPRHRVEGVDRPADGLRGLGGAPRVRRGAARAAAQRSPTRSPARSPTAARTSTTSPSTPRAGSPSRRRHVPQLLRRAAVPLRAALPRGPHALPRPRRRASASSTRVPELARLRGGAVSRRPRRPPTQPRRLGRRAAARARLTRRARRSRCSSTPTCSPSARRPRRCARRLVPEREVTFIVDRNVNYTNVCVSGCRFCAFYRDAGRRGRLRPHPRGARREGRRDDRARGHGDPAAGRHAPRPAASSGTRRCSRRSKSATRHPRARLRPARDRRTSRKLSGIPSPRCSRACATPASTRCPAAAPRSSSTACAATSRPRRRRQRRVARRDARGARARHLDDRDDDVRRPRDARGAHRAPAARPRGPGRGGRGRTRRLPRLHPVVVPARQHRARRGRVRASGARS